MYVIPSGIVSSVINSLFKYKFLQLFLAFIIISALTREHQTLRSEIYMFCSWVLSNDMSNDTYVHVEGIPMFVRLVQSLNVYPPKSLDSPEVIMIVFKFSFGI